MAGTNGVLADSYCFHCLAGPVGVNRLDMLKKTQVIVNTCIHTSYIINL